MVAGLIYIDRLIQRHPEFAFFVEQPELSHKLVLTAMLLASKSINDRTYSNKYWARVGGVSTPELNALELNLCFLLGFELMVDEAEFDAYYSYIASLAVASTSQLSQPLSVLPSAITVSTHG